jgi:hypothetical protein
MELFTGHVDSWLTLVGMCFVAIGVYVGIRIDLALMHSKQIAEKDLREKLENKVDRHIENDQIHYHRRAGDNTGMYGQFGG